MYTRTHTHTNPERLVSLELREIEESILASRILYTVDVAGIVTKTY